jgi:hypothetical protein
MSFLLKILDTSMEISSPQLRFMCKLVSTNDYIFIKPVRPALKEILHSKKCFCYIH